jgi:hypothetical protein
LAEPSPEAIIFLIGTISAAITSDAMTSDIVVVVKSCGIWSSFSGSTCPPTRPPIRLPSADARNQIPIIWLT